MIASDFKRGDWDVEFWTLMHALLVMYVRLSRHDWNQ